MHCQRSVSAALVVLLSIFGSSLAQEGASINWESYKEVDFEFGESLLRVGSDYQIYAYATDAPTDWDSTYAGPEITEITGPITAGFTSSQASSPRATANAITGWMLEKDDASGVATLSNAVSGHTAIVDRFDPTAAAVSWAVQTTSLEVGEEVGQGEIDWSPGILVGASGGSFISSYDQISIHDPIVVWTRDTDTGVVEPTTLFELNARFDSKTELHWNEVRVIQEGIDGQPELTLIPNDGPFLDASSGGSGSFRLRLDSPLLPAAQRGSLDVEFKDGLVTESSATGIFSDLAPQPNAVLLDDSLPEVGAPAVIDRIVIDNNDTGRFALNVNAGERRVITDVAACSDGVHVSVGPAVDTIQNFTLNPLQRLGVAPAEGDSALSESQGLCLGAIREDADLLFGNAYLASSQMSLLPEHEQNPIDHFLRLHPAKQAQTVVFDPGENVSPTDTRRWTAMFDTRLAFASQPEPIDPVEPVPLDREASGDGSPRRIRNDGVLVQRDGIAVAADLGDGNNGLTDEAPTFAVGLLRVAPAGDTPTLDRDALQPSRSLFQDTDGFVVAVTQLPKESIVRLLRRGHVIASGEVPAPEATETADAWQRFAFTLEQTHEGIALQLDMLGETAGDAVDVLSTTLPKQRLSGDGYQLALGSRLHHDHLAHDFDNLMVTFQQTGDLAWDGRITGDDVHYLHDAIEAQLTSPLLDIDLNGRVTLADLELLEDMVPNKRPGDANLDGLVNFRDFLSLAASFGQSTGLWIRGDFNADGFVNFRDFLSLARNYDTGEPRAAQSVPEPSSRLALLLCLLPLGYCRKRRAVLPRFRNANAAWWTFGMKRRFCRPHR